MSRHALCANGISICSLAATSPFFDLQPFFKQFFIKINHKDGFLQTGIGLLVLNILAIMNQTLFVEDKICIFYIRILNIKVNS